MGRAAKPKPSRFIARLTGDQLRKAKPFRFTKHDKDQLLAMLSDKLSVSPTDKRVRAFVRAAAIAIAGFKVYQELEKTRPTGRATQTTLKQLKQHSSGIRDELQTMNADTRFLLEVCLQAPTFHLDDHALASKKPPANKTLAAIEAARARRNAAQAFVDRLNQDLTSFDAAVALAQTAPSQTKQGRPKEHWRLGLATDIAWAFRELLKVRPAATTTTDVTEESPFESVLRICLHAAGVELKDVHRLARAAIRKLKEQETSKT